MSSSICSTTTMLFTHHHQLGVAHRAFLCLQGSSVRECVSTHDVTGFSNTLKYSWCRTSSRLLCKHQWLLFFLPWAVRKWSEGTCWTQCREVTEIAESEWWGTDRGVCCPPHPMENRQVCFCTCGSHQISWECWQPKRQLQVYFHSGPRGNVWGGKVDRSLREAAAMGTLAWAYALERYLESSGDAFPAPLTCPEAIGYNIFPSCAHWPLARKGLKFTSKDT